MPELDLHSPLRDAVRQLAARSVTPSGMTSREWASIQAQFRDRAFFSATVENERVLEEMKSRIQAAINNEKVDGATMGRERFIEEMRGVLSETSYKRPDGVTRKSVRSLKSRARLGLIWDMNQAMASGYARWVSDMTPEGLANEPAYELIRVHARLEIRLWPLIWEEHGGGFYGSPGKDYPGAKGRMIALKTDPIWRRISRFGAPWPPFDWGSGMGLRSVRREEADGFGLTSPDTGPDSPDFTPLAIPFNVALKSDIAALNTASRERLRSTFGDSIRIDKDELVWQRDNNPAETDEQRAKDITTSLKDRARKIADAGRDQIARIRSGDDAAPWPPGFDSSIIEPEILASTSAVAVGRKLLYHEQWHGSAQDAERFAKLIRSFLPPEVSVRVRDNHIHAWRPDLLDISVDDLQAMSAAGDNGVLLGYGQDLHVDPFAVVSILDSKGSVIGGFQAPAALANVYAALRRRDFTDALGIPVRILINGKELPS